MLNGRIEKLHVDVSENMSQDNTKQAPNDDPNQEPVEHVGQNLDDARQELEAMKNLRDCVQSAAEVASSASTALNVDIGESFSNFGDIFPNRSDQRVVAWIQSNPTQNYEDVGDGTPLFPDESNTNETSTGHQSDNDSDIEAEMLSVLFNDGKKRKEQGDLAGAASRFKNCLALITRDHNSASGESTVSRDNILGHLAQIYCMQECWSDAKCAMQQKLSNIEQRLGTKHERYLWNTLELATILMSNGEHDESRLLARRSLRGFKKLRTPGYRGYDLALRLLIEICRGDDRADEKEGYTALLTSHHETVGELSMDDRDARRTTPVSFTAAYPDDLPATQPESHQTNSQDMNFPAPPKNDSIVHLSETPDSIFPMAIPS